MHRLFNHPNILSLTAHTFVERGGKSEAWLLLPYISVSRLDNTHTQTHMLSHTHMPSHKHAHTIILHTLSHTHTHTLSHTHTHTLYVKRTQSGKYMLHRFLTVCVCVMQKGSLWSVLEKLRDKGSVMAERRVIRILQGICSGLKAMHDRGYAHRYAGLSPLTSTPPPQLSRPPQMLWHSSNVDVR